MSHPRLLRLRVRHLLAAMLALVLMAPVLVATPVSAQSSTDSPDSPDSDFVVQVAVRANSLRALEQHVTRIGATVVRPVAGSDDIFVVERPVRNGSPDHPLIDQWTRELATDLDDRSVVRWAVPASSTVSASFVEASRFYAWNVEGSRFYAWNGENPQSEGYDLEQYLDLGTTHGRATGAGITVAVVDTGFDTSHPMIESRLLPGMDFVDGDTNVSDEPNHLDDDGDGSVDEAAGHGTHIAGIIAQVAPDAQILPIRVLDADGVGSVYNVVAGIEYAIDHGADVINLSFGTDLDEPALQDVVENAARHGVVLVAAAGNDGTTFAQHPARHAWVLGVAAYDPAASTVADFGTWGASVDVAALGVGVRSAALNGDTIALSGSSIATPIVAAQAALIQEAHPEWTPRLVTNQVRATAEQRLLETRPTAYGTTRLDLSLTATAASVPIIGPNIALVVTGQTAEAVSRQFEAPQPDPEPTPIPPTSPPPALTSAPTAEPVRGAPNARVSCHADGGQISITAVDSRRTIMSVDVMRGGEFMQNIRTWRLADGFEDIIDTEFEPGATYSLVVRSGNEKFTEFSEPCAGPQLPSEPAPPAPVSESTAVPASESTAVPATPAPARSCSTFAWLFGC